MLSPFKTAPLSTNPFNSRIGTYYRSLESVKNYVLLAFNPGYALQASELNELQELFFLNSNLSQRSNALWTTSETGRIPFWEGLIPYNPADITIRVISQNMSLNTISFTVKCNNSWFLWTDPSSRFSNWIYNDQTSGAIEKLFTLTNTASSTYYFGYNVTKTTVNCCQSESCGNDDETLRDNSSGDTVGAFNTCGASRINVTFSNNPNDFESRQQNSTTGQFRSIFKITTNGNDQLTAKFIDNQELMVSV